jgi:hypothetical protein
MDLAEAKRKKLEAVELISHMATALNINSQSLPGVGITSSLDSKYQLFFHLASRADYQLAIKLCSKLNIKGEPDVEVTGQAFALLGDHSSRSRPLNVGAYISPENFAGGTLGCFVRKEADPESLFVLSCTHVVALSRNCRGEPIFQPKKSTLIDNIVAHIDDYIPLTLASAGNATNALDAAIAKVVCRETINRADSPNSSIQLRGNHAQNNVPSLIKRTVFKIGSTSQRTVGWIKGYDLDLELRYIDPSNLEPFYCRYQNLIVIKSEKSDVPFCCRGDSGSLIYDDKGYAVGLLIGGIESQNIGYALPIEPILNRLGIQLILS